VYLRVLLYCAEQINYYYVQMQRALKSTITPSEPVTVCQADTGGW